MTDADLAAIELIVATKSCGCCVGVAYRHDPSVQQWIDEGLAVRKVSRAEWLELQKTFLECPHESAPPEPPETGEQA